MRHEAQREIKKRAVWLCSRAPPLPRARVWQASEPVCLVGLDVMDVSERPHGQDKSFAGFSQHFGDNFTANEWHAIRGPADDAGRFEQVRVHANVAAAAPNNPGFQTVVFSRVPPGMRPIHPHKCHLCARPPLAHAQIAPAHACGSLRRCARQRGPLRPRRIFARAERH